MMMVDQIVSVASEVIFLVTGQTFGWSALRTGDPLLEPPLSALLACCDCWNCILRSSYHRILIEHLTA
jgi:hypothetical protein